MTLTVAGWIGAILGFGFLVLFHEIGHFLALRWFGLPVFAFSVGFGSPLWKKQLGQTEYRLGWLPLGGYVMPEDPEIAEKREQEGGCLLPEHPPAAQFWVALAGPAANLLLGFALFLLLMTVWGEPMPGLTVDSVVKGSPAAVAGLQSDDRLVSINGVTLRDWNQFVEQIQLNRQRSGLIGIRREEREIALPITAVQEGERFVLGVRPRFESSRPQTLQAAVAAAFTRTIQETVTVSHAMINLLTLRSTQNVAGPVGILGMAGNAVLGGWVAFLSLMAILSVNLAVFNLLPIPPLDGVRLIVSIWHWVTGKAMPERLLLPVYQWGALGLAMLFLLVTIKDIGGLLF